MDLRVLVVDDDAATLYLMVQGLKQAPGGGVTVVVESANSGERAIKLLEERGPDFDLVVSDFKMDAANGGQVLAAARALAPRAARVLVSGFAGGDVLAQARAHAHRFFEKPGDYLELNDLMQRCVNLAVERLRASQE